MASTHRIALISDLHGNAIALRAVLRSIEGYGVDETVCLGDVATLGVAPIEVIESLRDLGCRCVNGNHDDYLIEPGLVHEHTEMSVVVDAIEWCRAGLSSQHLEFVRGFEEGFELPLGDGHRLTLFHGSPSSNTVDLLADTPSATFEAQLGPERSTVMAGGHTHIQMLRQHRGTLVVNPGSVGAPFETYVNGNTPTILPHAEYATIEALGRDVAVTLHRVELNQTELLHAAQESQNPMASQMARTYL